MTTREHDRDGAAGGVVDDPTDVDERRVDRGPSRFGVVVGGVAAAFATLSTALAGGGGTPIAAVGGLLLVTAGLTDTRVLVAVGTATTFVGVVLAGLGGGLAGPLLLAMVGTVVAWDTLDNAFSVGEQLGSETHSRRVITVHAAITTAVGVGGAAVSFGVYLAASGGQPVTTLLMLLVGVLLVGWALR